VYHRNEYVAETLYTLQLSPMMRLQPDLQIVWNPAFNPEPGPFTVVQTQFILNW
jgi:carbohydrate-selective porin OprB